MKLCNLTNIALASSFALASGLSVAELKALDDEVLSDVSGQSGLTLDIQNNTQIAEVAYFDDGLGIALQGVRLASASDPNGFHEYRAILDILNDGSLSYEIQSSHQSRFEIEEIRFIDTPGITPAADAESIGGIFFDYTANGTILVENTGNVARGSHGAVGGLYDIDLVLSDGRLGYRTNGNELFLDGMELSINSMDTLLGATPGGELNLEMPNLQMEMSVDAIRYSNNPNNHGVTNDVDSGLELASYGSLWMNLDASLSTLIRAGGAVGSDGLTLNANTNFNRFDFAYGDDTDFAGVGHWLGALGMTGSVALTNMTVDVLDDPDSGVTPAKDYGRGLALSIESLQANISVADLVLGETKTNIDAYVADGSTPVKSIGGVEVNLLFADGTFDSTPLTNQILLQAGGNTDAGYQGLRLDTQLSLISPNNESNFVYIDDGNAIMFSGLEAYVDGDITVDVTSLGNINGTDFYDGLRVGFEDMAFGYRIEGYRVAEHTGDTNDLKTRDLQAAQSIPGLSAGLLGLGGPAVEGTLNGHATIAPGGNVGQEGITINADLTVSDGAMASFIQADGSGNGLWLSGLNYDVHLRDMMLDVTAEGLKVYEGETWSTMDVTDFRVGDKAAGSSFGRLVFDRFETGTETTVSAGGAGAVCIGGSGADAAACGADGGRWEDRGSKGLSFDIKRHFAAADETLGRRNRVVWETNRTGEGTATPVNGSGMQLVFDNFTTNDGDGLTDTYGFNTDYDIDVSRTRVVKKADGPDSNGVVGNKGDEKIMNPDGSYRYVAPAALTASDIANRPVGLAVRTRTHFKELDFESVKLSHPVGGDSTLLYGMKMQNFDVKTDITTTTLD